MNSTELRESIFRHLDGIVIVPIASILKEKQITDYLLKVKKITLKELATHYNANPGYLNVALRALASQGFLEYDVNNEQNEVFISINSLSEIAFSQFHLYDDVAKNLFFTDVFTANTINSHSISILRPLFQKYKNKLDLKPDLVSPLGKIQFQILKHIDKHLEIILL